ncbi:A/G-specific adenine glycosylase [Methylohalomonas lacus]|uniref:A/G-specific adenine glycosylase n=1 Tax=Methylohalomonas lacus TaxID=398773 RepID=A0AAE3HH43_9GAMM|nr:hypothetical protein [Methylohalomonas lacus]MCS3902194.1 A/G-specific adenine glycosylase [Methylohalomonas lacus]
MTEILLQRTRAANVAAFYDDFFSHYPDWYSLTNADSEGLESFLRPLGIWRRRTATLVNLANAIMEMDGRVPHDRVEIEKLPGVGQYVANAIQLLAAGTPAPLLDAGMARVLERYFGPRTLADIRYDKYLQDLAWRVVSCDKAIEVNWGILDLSAVLCKNREPLCSQCPLKKGCNYYQGNVSERLV